MNIKNLITYQGLTQQDVAEKLGMTTVTLRTKINNPDKFTIGEAKKLKKIGIKIEI
jgi:transcriptional regulator with XRE-family HTH domain